MYKHHRPVWGQFGKGGGAGAGRIRVEDGIWFEGKDEIREKLRYGHEKSRLLAWVRLEMAVGLSAREELCLRLHFFENQTIREIAATAQIHTSSVYRAVRRAIRKLRSRAMDQGGVAGVLGLWRRGQARGERSGPPTTSKRPVRKRKPTKLGRVAPGARRPARGGKGSRKIQVFEKRSA